MGVTSAESVDTPLRGDHWGCVQPDDDSNQGVVWNKTPIGDPQSGGVGLNGGSPYNCVDFQHPGTERPAVHIDGAGSPDGKSFADARADDAASSAAFGGLKSALSPVGDALSMAASPFINMF